MGNMVQMQRDSRRTSVPCDKVIIMTHCVNQVQEPMPLVPKL